MNWIKVHYLENYQGGPLEMNQGDVCFDLRTAIPEKEEILPGEIKKIPLGVRLEPPEGYGVKIYPRSGWAKEGLSLANSVGIVDNGYRGEVVALMVNMNLSDWIVVNPGDRIVQGELAPIRQIGFRPSDDLSETERGSSGLGSTGRQ